MALLGRVFLRIRQPVYAQSHSPAKAHERYFAGASHPWYVCKRPRGTLRIPERLEEKMGAVSYTHLTLPTILLV